MIVASCVSLFSLRLTLHCFHLFPFASICLHLPPFTFIRFHRSTSSPEKSYTKWLAQISINCVGRCSLLLIAPLGVYFNLNNFGHICCASSSACSWKISKKGREISFSNSESLKSEVLVLLWLSDSERVLNFRTSKTTFTFFVLASISKWNFSLNTFILSEFFSITLQWRVFIVTSLAPNPNHGGDQSIFGPAPFFRREGLDSKS